MIFEIIKLPIVPNGDMPTLHFSQADKGRDFGIQLVDLSGDTIDPTAYLLEFHLRKVDDTIVTLDTAYKLNNVTFFRATEQFCACIGQNLGEVVVNETISGARLGTLNCFVNVERDPLINGLTSESEIHNLRDQIEEIAGEVIGDDYYNKTEVDDLLDLKADKSDIPDLNDYYTKSQTDSLLSGKVDQSDLNDYYDKTETDNLLAYKADIEDLPDMSDYYTKEEINELIITYDTTESAAVAVFVTDIPYRLKGLEASVMATQEGTGNPTPVNIRNIIPVESINVSVKDSSDVLKSTTEIELGYPIYGGVLNTRTGEISVTHYKIKGLAGTSFNAVYNGTYGSGYRFWLPYYSTDVQVISAKHGAICNMKHEETAYFGSNRTGSNPEVANDIFAISTGGDLLCVYDSDPTLTKEQFEAKYTDIEFVYPLAEAVTIPYTLTPDQINTIKGTNKISHDGNGNISVTFYESIRKYLDDTRED